ncbi:hyalin [Apostichopus japonicus]|uniref:Hyalin n=1 Tax=Stichopus japonicus TaxID=307972 RepID=A0A2G8LBQ7_STIJA|nr:hyalin [Apostichopus japonicus]
MFFSLSPPKPTHISSSVDTVPPVISDCPPQQTETVELGQTSAQVVWFQPSATDNSGTATLQTQTHSPGDAFVIGQTTVRYIFVDPASNPAICEFIVLVQTVDTTPPDGMGCPQSVVETVELGVTSVPVFWVEPTVTDISGTERLDDRSHQPGQSFMVGLTTVTYVFSDASNNIARCTFNVIVTTEDTTPPSITGCPVQPVVEQVELGTIGTFVTWTPPTATDMSDPVTVNVNQNPGSFFLVGTMAITYTFTDAENNQNICRFDVVVTTKVFQCPSEARAIVELGITSSVVRYDEPFATDNSNAPNLLQTQTCQPGGSYPVGDTNCLYLFVDPDGNSNSCTFRIIVTTIDTTPPTISNCPTAGASTIVELGLLDGAVFWSEPTATDLAGATLLPRTGRPGDSFPLGATPLVYVFTDPSGNEATCTFIVTVTTDRGPESGRAKCNQGFSTGRGRCCPGVIEAVSYERYLGISKNLEEGS